MPHPGRVAPVAEAGGEAAHDPRYPHHLAEQHAVCERVAYECLDFDDATGRYTARNTPHAAFLTPNVLALRASFEDADADPLQVAARWGAFLRDGTPALPALRDEPDDKTLVLAVRAPAPDSQRAAASNEALPSHP